MKDGTNVFVETSHDECEKFLWHHGDIFTDSMGNAGEVMGVGFGTGSMNNVRVLWVVLDKNRRPNSGLRSGNASYYANKSRTADASNVCIPRPVPESTVFDDVLSMFGKK
ncbi:MAG: hypothetical protein NTZ36_00360 [Candidatus Jorgensenbacteria bacterium]|nr:hypothetical protein [Candidatus Jorgensenbacteria bacterium]